MHSTFAPTAPGKTALKVESKQMERAPPCSLPSELSNSTTQVTAVLMTGRVSAQELSQKEIRVVLGCIFLLIFTGPLQVSISTT